MDGFRRLTAVLQVAVLHRGRIDDRSGDHRYVCAP